MLIADETVTSCVINPIDEKSKTIGSSCFVVNLKSPFPFVKLPSALPLIITDTLLTPSFVSLLVTFPDMIVCENEGQVTTERQAIRNRIFFMLFRFKTCLFSRFSAIPFM
jgi:hypothetical protein